jgi:hypothetical protein
MEAVSTFEISVSFQQTTWCNISEDSYLQCLLLLTVWHTDMLVVVFALLDVFPYYIFLSIYVLTTDVKYSFPAL